VLLHHRYLVDEIQQNLSLVPSAVEELLRTQIAVSSTANLVYATEDIELDGYTIRKGASVVLSMESANVDETVFDDPFTINIRSGVHTSPHRPRETMVSVRAVAVWRTSRLAASRARA
jgi:cytochrome P450